MDRFEDSPGLFGRGLGFGTSAEITCRWCGVTYNEGANDDNEDEIPGEDVHYVVFAEQTICECCFPVIERAVLSHMPDIIPWYRRILDSNQRKLDNAFKSISGITPKS